MVRVTGFLVLNPVLGSEMIPMRYRVGIAFFLALAVFPRVSFAPNILCSDLVVFCLVIVREMIIGIFFGVVVMMIFEGIRMAGEILGLQMGFGIVNVVDPQASIELSILAVYKFMLAILIFLIVNGHHKIISAIARSFDLLPVGTLRFTLPVKMSIIDYSNEIFRIGVKISLPLMLPLIIVTVVLGMLSKAVPKIQVFLMSFPLRIGVGLIILGIATASLIAIYKGMFQELFSTMAVIIKGMH